MSRKKKSKLSKRSGETYLKSDLFPYISNLNGLKDISSKNQLFLKIILLVNLGSKYFDNYMQYNEEIVLKCKEIFDLLKDDYTFMINNLPNNMIIIELLETSFVHKYMLPKYKRIYGICYSEADYLNLAQTILIDNIKWSEKINLNPIKQKFKENDPLSICWICNNSDDIRRYNTINSVKYKLKKMFLCKNCADDCEECCYYCGRSGNIQKRLKNGGKLKLCDDCDECMYSFHGELYIDSDNIFEINLFQIQ